MFLVCVFLDRGFEGLEWERDGVVDCMHLSAFYCSDACALLRARIA